MQEITKDKNSEELGGFRIGRDFVDHVFNLTIITEETLTKEREEYATCIDLGKAHDRIDWTAM